MFRVKHSEERPLGHLATGAVLGAVILALLLNCGSLLLIAREYHLLGVWADAPQPVAISTIQALRGEVLLQVTFAVVVSVALVSLRRHPRLVSAALFRQSADPPRRENAGLQHPGQHGPRGHYDRSRRHDHQHQLGGDPALRGGLRLRGKAPVPGLSAGPAVGGTGRTACPTAVADS